MKQQSTISPEALGFFHDPSASSVLSLSGQHLVAPTVRGQDLTDEEIGMGGGVRLIMLLFDRSPSMKPVTQLMLDGFGQYFIDAVREAREDDVAALRFAGLSFSSDITPIWNQKGVSFHKLEDLPPLTPGEYDPERGVGTASHQALIDGTHLAMEYAGQIERDTGIKPEIEVILLSDGLNNENPRSKNPVKLLIQGCKTDLIRFTFLFFETMPGACKSKDSDVNPELNAAEMRFDSENVKSFAQKPGETELELKKRFRRMMRVASRVSASKGVSAVKAAAAVQAAVASGEDVL
jgi:hypothetical protein